MVRRSSRRVSCWTKLLEGQLKPGHGFGTHESVVVSTVDISAGNCRFPQAGIFPVRLQGNGSGLVVTDFRHERGHEHKRILHVGVNSLLVGGQAGDAVVRKAVARIAEKRVGLQYIIVLAP